MKYVEKAGKKYYVIVELHETVNDKISWTVHARSKVEYEKIEHLNFFTIRRVLDNMGLTNSAEIVFTPHGYDSNCPCLLNAQNFVTDSMSASEVMKRLNKSVFLQYLEKNHD